MGQFVRMGQTITFGSRKTPNGYAAIVHVNGVSRSTQIALSQHAKTAWRRAKKEALKIWRQLALREAICKPADLSGLRAMIGGENPILSRLERLDYNNGRSSWYQHDILSA